MLRLQPRFLALFLVLLALEVGIARYIHSGPVRAFVGDVLVVPTLFFLLRGCVQLPVALAAGLVLGFAGLVEVSQAFALVDWLDRITERSLLNQLAQAVETSLKEQESFSEFEWKS